MSRKKIYFRADASVGIGYGHFIRTLALADMLKDDFDCTFFTQSPNEYQILEISKVCRLVSLPNDNTKFDLFLNYLTGNEIVWLDNYFYTSSYQKEIVDKGCKLICIGSNDKHYYAHAVVNYIKKANEFNAENYTKFYIGLQWCLLRKEFLEIDNNDYNNKRKDVIICYGGTDHLGLTEKTVKILSKVLPEYKIHLIATTLFGKERINNLRKENVNTHIDVSPADIAQLLKMSSIAIVSASTIVQEAIACGIRIFAGYYMDNQMDFYDYLLDKNYIEPLGNLREDFSLKLEQNLSSLSKHIIDNSSIFKGLKNRYITLFNNI